MASALKRVGKVYYFDPGELAFTEGDGVIVETVRGIEYGDVAMLPREVPETEVVAPLKPVIRVATEADKRQVQENEQKEREALVIGAERIAEHKLDMETCRRGIYLRREKGGILLYSGWPGVDFRDLVRDLAARFRTRIELRQIGVRDEAKMLGGLGPCGRIVCCKSFMNDFIPVSIRMAKDQSISLNPTKISGLCGRLMCCLQFEHETYVKARKELPKAGADVITPDGPGEVAEVQILRERLKVRVTLPDMTCDLREYAPSELQIVSKEEREAAVKELADKAPVVTPRPPRPAPEPRPWQKAKAQQAERVRQEATIREAQPEETEGAEPASLQEGQDKPRRPRRRPEGARQPAKEDAGEKKAGSDRPRRNRHFQGGRRKGGPGNKPHEPSANKTPDNPS